ncbi:MAG: putative DNA binding domain-containing protein [Acidobacteria bacterium]|nr:putative DNA binding domain-containing protein [Acidobacteriota bacterium]
MPFEIKTITTEQAEKVINYQEGQYGDVKAKEKKPASLSEDISAFANADGGDLYIGIDELKVNGVKTRSWRGFSDPEEANAHAQVFDTLFPAGSEFQYEFLSCHGLPGLVMHATINKSRGVTLATNNVPYLRRNASSLPQNTLELRRRLEYAKGIHSFESESANAVISLVTESEIIREFVEGVVPTATPVEYLRKQGLIRDEKPTVAGVLLFADEPQAIIPKHCGIKIYRYKTTAQEGFREAEAFIPKTVEGCLYKQIRSAVSLTTELIQQIPKIGVGAEFEHIQYPPQTLHEIITNAVIHRDYSITDDIHIRIFDNRIEVQSPGRLPANMTVKNLTTQRAARNGTIQRILNKFPDPPNRDVGEGIKTATAAMTALGLEPPTFKETESSFLVSIKHEKLATAELAIMDYLESHETINNKQARSITFIHEDWKVKSIFRRMELKKMIRQVEGTTTSATKYRKWAPTDNPQQTDLF